MMANLAQDWTNHLRQQECMGPLPHARGRLGREEVLRCGQKEEEYGPSVTHMIQQPQTQPISQEQLVAEVKGIYAGVVMVESKCIQVDKAHIAHNYPPERSNKQWQVLVDLHGALLHEHYDFFLASQHPSASPALRRLAREYSIPTRKWRHGIQSFLELLRHRLLASPEQMLAFVYLAYSMMALLYETVSVHEGTWTECLGDIGRRSMAIEDDGIRLLGPSAQVARIRSPKTPDKSYHWPNAPPPWQFGEVKWCSTVLISKKRSTSGHPFRVFS